MAGRILVLNASTRSASPNAALADEATRRLALGEAAVALVSLADYPLPLFDRDADAPLPQNAMLLARRVRLVDALLLVAPAVDGAPSALLKNALEWTSRLRTEGGRPARPFRGLPVALALTAGDAAEAGEAAASLRLALRALGAETLARQLLCPPAALPAVEWPLDASQSAELDALLGDLLAHALAFMRNA